MYDAEILTAIKTYMIKNQQTVAVAESVTSGHLQAAFSTVEEATDFFQGGVTVYNIDQKNRLLQVERNHAESCNCVSEKVATEMAMTLCGMFSCDWALSVTGYAAPDDRNDKDYLYAICAVAFRGELVQTKFIKAPYKEMLENQVHYTNAILSFFSQILKKYDSGEITYIHETC